MARLKLKIQLYCGDEIALGPGKAELLEAIAAEGSISAAARSLGMSYRRGWLLVDAMNRCFCEPLVEARAGGGKSAGARVTVAGAEVLAAYRALERAVGDKARGEDLARIERAIRTSPLPPAD